jgi:HEAT repeat protein
MSPEAAEQLAAQLGPQCGEEEDPLIRAEMVLTLGALKSERARQSLVAAGNDPDSKVRIAACKAWAGIGDETASSELARILSSDMDQDVRFAAAKGLGKAGGPHAVAALGSALEDRDPAMQYLAMESLKQTSGQDYGRDVRLWKQYVQGQTPVREEKSIAQRARDLF